jgi:catechol 2,3-dioxygenase-like lactoylglutathione lyase family enzyme
MVLECPQAPLWRAMNQSIGAVSLLVREYDEAIAFYTQKLRFSVEEDRDMGGGRRWVLLAPPGSTGTRLLLARAKNKGELASVGRQAGGRVFLFLHTDDFEGDHREMLQRGVKFNEEPRHEDYGTVAVFEDLYGNTWDLLMPRVSSRE